MVKSGKRKEGENTDRNKALANFMALFAVSVTDFFLYRLSPNIWLAIFVYPILSVAEFIAIALYLYKKLG